MTVDDEPSILIDDGMDGMPLLRDVVHPAFVSYRAKPLPNRCQFCNGYGWRWYWRNNSDNARGCVRCNFCRGSGLQSDAVYHALTSTE